MDNIPRPSWYGQEEEPKEQTSAPRPSFFGAGESTSESNIVDRVRADRRYADLVQVQRLLQRAQVDPAVGDVNTLMNRIEDLTDELLTEYGMDRRAFGQLVVGDAGQQQNLLGDQVKNLEDTLTAAAGILEPFEITGDVARTFTSNLADVQASRDASSGGRDVTVAGSPASTPWQAASEMARAGVATFKQLGFDQNAFTLNAEEDRGVDVPLTDWRFGLNPESGWAVYLPNVEFGRFSFGADLSPRETGRAVTGRELNERFGVYDRLDIGEDEEELREWVGLATEVITDPLLFADFLWGSARVAGTAARVTGSAGARSVATKLDDLAVRATHAMTPAGAVRAVGETLRPLGITDMVNRSMTRTINRMLDVELPPGLAAGAGRRAAAGTLGWDAAEGASFNPRLRDFLFQQGQIEGVDSRLPRALTGGATAGPSGLGLVDAASRAFGSEQVIRSLSIRGAKKVYDAMTDGLTQPRPWRLPFARIAVQDARFLRPDYETYVRGLGEVLADFVDNTPVAIRGVPKEYKTRLEALSELHGIPYQETLNRFQNANTEMRHTVLQTGYAASGYEDYTTAMQRAAGVLNEDYNDLRRAHELLIGQTDLQTIEAAGGITTIRPGSTGATANNPAAMRRAQDIANTWRNDPDAFDMWKQAVADELTAMGRSDLAGVDPQAYLTGMRTGYLRRMFEGVSDPAGAVRSLTANDVILVREVQPDALATSFATAFGNQAEDVVRNFFVSRTPPVPRGQQATEVAMSFRADDLAEAITRATGREVSPEEIARVVNSDNKNAMFLDETIQFLTGRTTAAPAGFSGAAPFARVPGATQARQDLTPENLASLLQVRNPVQQLTAGGRVSARTVRSREMLGMTYDALTEMNAILDPSQIPHGPSNAIWAFDHSDGVRYVALPDGPQWGPLAGKAIPEDVARTVTYATAFRSVDANAYERVVNMWRRGLLSPLASTVRDVVGNYLLMGQAGAAIPDLLQNTPRAFRIRREFLDTGLLPQEFRGYENLFEFMRETTRTGSIENELAAAMNRAAGGESIPTVLDRLEGVVRTATETPLLGGFLGARRTGEEVSRMAGFLTTYDRLIAAGQGVDDAVQAAAHFAANASYNYGNLPLIPEVLRRTGLSAFPQFAWYNTGRVPRAMLENPGVMVKAQYARELANEALVEGDDEYALTAGLNADWLRYSSPFAIPIPGGKPGTFYVGNLGYVLPWASDTSSLLSDPLTAGVVKPVIEAAGAWMGGSGVPTFGARFGQRVFDESSSFGVRMMETADYFGQQMFLPGTQRLVRSSIEGVQYNGNQEMFDMWGLATGRWYNSDYYQLAGRMVGFPTYKASTNIEDPSFNQAMRSIYFRYQGAIDSWTKKLEEAAFMGDNRAYNEAIGQIERLEMKRSEEQNNLLEAFE